MIVNFLYSLDFKLLQETKNIDFVPTVGSLVKIGCFKYKVTSVIYVLDDNYFNVKLERIHDLSSNS